VLERGIDEARICIRNQNVEHDASRSQWQEYALEINEILHIFSSGTQSMGDSGPKKAFTGPRTGMYLPTKFGCDRSIVVGSRSWNDRQTDKQNGMTIRLTLCERDAIIALLERCMEAAAAGR